VETWISVAISLLALSVSGATAWLTLFKDDKQHHMPHIHVEYADSKAVIN
jgi:hypothetical protein